MKIKDLEDPRYDNVVAKFSAFVNKCEKKFFNNGLPATWYRGETRKHEEGIIPGMLRNDVVSSLELQELKTLDPLWRIWNMEHTLLYNFKKEGSAIHDKSLSNKEWYYLAQHHGLRTRLLDWSNNPRIALWFASQNDKEDGYIHIINGSDYCCNLTTAEKRGLEAEYYDFVFRDKNPTPEELRKYNGQVISLYPDNYNQRQSRQLSLFTLHLPDFSALKEYYTPTSTIPSPCPFVIPKEDKPIYRAFLAVEGMRRWHVLPDLDNLAKGLNEDIIC